MSDQEYRDGCNKMGFDNVRDGYTILIDENRINEFMDSQPLNSTGYLDYFDEIGVHLNQRVNESGGVSFVALSVSDNRTSRDFAALQIAHKLARSGKSVLIVDCDFLNPGLSGMVENIEDYGFLDLLLYGSSLKSVSKSTGIEGVSITGPGSFPVSRTVPFALKEFERIKSFLMKRYQVVIFCTTLYTDSQELNPIIGYADEVVLCCRIENMEEGELQKDLSALGGDAPPTNLVCFCREHEQESVKEMVGGKEEADKEKEEKPVEGKPEEGSEKPGEREDPEEEEFEEGEREEEREEEEPVYIEKTDEIEGMEEEEEEKKSRIPRLIIIGVAAVIVVFVVWWLMMDRTISEREPDRKTAERIQKERQAREAEERDTGGEEVAATGGVKQENETGEEEGPVKTAEKTPVREEAPAQPTGFYYVHVASFKELDRAREEMQRYRDDHFDASLISLKIKGETWYRVAVGRYPNHEEAANAKIDIISEINAGYASIKKFEKGKLTE